MEIMGVKAVDNSLCPVTPIDADAVNKLKIGQAVKLKVTTQKPRSLQHHRLFSAGYCLLPLITGSQQVA